MAKQKLTKMGDAVRAAQKVAKRRNAEIVLEDASPIADGVDTNSTPFKKKPTTLAEAAKAAAAQAAKASTPGELRTVRSTLARALHAKAAALHFRAARMLEANSPERVALEEKAHEHRTKSTEYPR